MDNILRKDIIRYIVDANDYVDLLIDVIEKIKKYDDSAALAIIENELKYITERIVSSENDLFLHMGINVDITTDELRTMI